MMLQTLPSSRAVTSYSASPLACWRTLVQASVSATSMSSMQLASTPIVCIVVASPRRTTGTLNASRGSWSVNVISTKTCYPAVRGSLDNADDEVLDHGIGQQGRGNLLD